MPRGFSIVTIYSFKFILNVEPVADAEADGNMEKFLFRAVDGNRFRFSSGKRTAELASLKTKSFPQNEEKTTVTHEGCFSGENDEEGTLANCDWWSPLPLQFGIVSEYI